MTRTITTILAAMLITGCTFSPKLNNTHNSTFDLYTKIYQQQHTLRKNPRYQSESAAGLFRLNDWGISFVANLYDFLQNKENARKIADGLEKSVDDGVEYSGYIDTKDRNIEFVMSSTENRHWYTTLVPPLKPVIGVFHYHASKENCTDYAGPSDVDIATEASQKGIPGIVITKLKSRNFNVDVYFGSNPPIVIDMGNYSY